MRALISLLGATLALSTAAMAAETAKTPSYAPGLNAEIYIVGKYDELKSIPDKPSGVPLGIIVDGKAPQLEYGVWMHDKNMEGYNQENLVGVLWKGFLRVKEKGIHIFSVKDYEKAYHVSCQVHGWLNGRNLFEIGYSKARREAQTTDQNAFDLTPGLYEIQVWKACVWDSPTGRVASNKALWNSSSSRFMMKTPSQTSIQPVDSTLLVHETN